MGNPNARGTLENMKTLIMAITFVTLARLATAEDHGKPSREYEIGVMVLEIEAALKAPGDESLATIVRYGTDSRHYVMIRGWLAQLLKGTESQRSAARDPDLKRKHQESVEFLKKAIRRIDLE